MKPGDVVLGRFVVERQIGRGGMGTVYRARDDERGGWVAIKTLRAPREDDARRFVREARALSELDDDAVVGYRAHGVTDEGDLFLAMAWIDGETLFSRLRRGRLGVEESVLVASRVARALGHVHTRGIVHRDVKPANVILPEGDVGRATLVDFGIASFSGSVGARMTALTRKGIVVGTPGYVAPEQVRGQDIDGRADVFALGCVLFECLTGVRAFDGENVAAVLGKIVFEEAPRVNEVRDGAAPAELDALVAAMLEKPREARPASMEEVLAALSTLPSTTAAVPIETRKRTSFLTGDEQRFVCVVAARASEARDAGTDEAVLLADDEALRGRLLRAAERVLAEIELLPDGSVLAVVARGSAPTDLAVRAARLALALPPILGGGPISVVTGRAVVSGRAPVGDAIDRAARLLRARPEGIGLDEDTADLLGERFDVERDASGPRLRRERDAAVGARTLLGRVTPCVGRKRELERLTEMLDDAVRASSPRALLVTGEAGMGKTRLLTEALSRFLETRPLRLLSARGDELRSGSAFAMIAPALRAMAAIMPKDDVVVCREKLRAMVTEAGVAPSIEERTSMFLGELTGVPFPSEQSPALEAARSDPTLMSDQVRAAFVELLRAEGRHHPVLIVLEDLQWGDGPTVELVDQALRALEGTPLFVLALARPEVEQTFPRLFSERGAARLELSKLDPSASTTLVRAVLRDACDDERAREIVDRADGNAFLLEELIRAASEGRGADELPNTMLGMIEARLAMLDPGARRVLRAASVFGETFWQSGIEALLGPTTDDRLDVGAWLDELTRLELLVPSVESRFAHEREHRFRQALLRDAAHATLTAEDTRRGHLRAAEWLARVGETDTAVLAEHLERGGDRVRAAEKLLVASREALEDSDLRGALSLAEKGLSLAESGDLRGRLLLRACDVGMWLGLFERSRQWALEALRVLDAPVERWQAIAQLAVSSFSLGGLDAIGDSVSELERAAPGDGPDGAWAESMCNTAMAHCLIGDLETSRRLSDSLADHIEPALLSPMRRARIFQLRGALAAATGDIASAIEWQEDCLEIFDWLHATRFASVTRLTLAALSSDLGDADIALPILERAVDEARGLGLHYNEAYGRYALGVARCRVGDFRGALDTLTTSAAEQHALGDVRLEAAARYDLALVCLALGDTERALEDAERAVELTGPMPAYGSTANAVLARVHLARGDVPRAIACAETAERLAGETPPLDREALVHVTYVEALFAAGRAEEAKSAVTRATERLNARASRIADEERRRGFLTRVPENARTLELARRLGA